MTDDPVYHEDVEGDEVVWPVWISPGGDPFAHYSIPMRRRPRVQRDGLEWAVGNILAGVTAVFDRWSDAYEYADCVVRTGVIPAAYYRLGREAGA